MDDKTVEKSPISETKSADETTMEEKESEEADRGGSHDTTGVATDRIDVRLDGTHGAVRRGRLAHDRGAAAHARAPAHIAKCGEERHLRNKNRAQTKREQTERQLL